MLACGDILLTVCLPIMAVWLSLFLPPNDWYLYLRPRKKERDRYRKKGYKKAADCALSHITDSANLALKCSMVALHSIKFLRSIFCSKSSSNTEKIVTQKSPFKHSANYHRVQALTLKKTALNTRQVSLAKREAGQASLSLYRKTSTCGACCHKNCTTTKAYHGSRRHGKLAHYAARLKAAATLRCCRSSSQKSCFAIFFGSPKKRTTKKPTLFP